MRTILHLLTTPSDELASTLVEFQKARAVADGFRIQVIDLTATATPDYLSILDQIFEADSVTTW